MHVFVYLYTCTSLCIDFVSTTYRGKGDYFRLGHGDDSHQRTPKRVLGVLAAKREVDVACGSLHCLVCTEDGKVYAWGDNDEGQIGNDSTSACQVAHVNIYY